MTPTAATESSSTATPAELKVASAAQTSSTSRNASPQVKNNAAPNATATVEVDVLDAYKTFAHKERKNVDAIRVQKARNDKEVKLNDLKKFADSFKLNTPVPSDLVYIIAKDPEKRKAIAEKAKRIAEEAKANPAEAVKPVASASEAKPAARAAPPTPSSNGPNRQNANRNMGFQHQGPHNNSQSFRREGQQAVPSQQTRPPGNLGARLRNIEQQNKHTQLPVNPMPVHEARLPPTGPSNIIDPNFSRRSSGVASAQGGRLNPNSSEFRPSPHAPTFNPNGNPSSGSSPRSATTVVQPPAPATKSLLKRKPTAASERPSLKEKYNALEYIMSLKPGPGKDWEKTGGLKPAYDTPPTWRTRADDEEPEYSSYTKFFEKALFATETMSPPNPSHAVPQVAHQHQLPFHLQQGVHNMGPRQSPRQPHMNLHGNQHGHGPNPPFNGPDDHRMMPSQSAQSYASPRPHNAPMAFPTASPMSQPAQLPYNPMMQYPGAPPMQQQFRSQSQSHQFMPQQQQMGPIMIQNPTNSFMTSQGMAPGPQIMYPQGGPHFMPLQNGHPPTMPGVNGYPSPGRSAPMMMSQGSQQGHQPQPSMYGNMNPGMSPGPQYGHPVYPQQQPPGQSKFN